MNQISPVFFFLFLNIFISVQGQDAIKLEAGRCIERNIAPGGKHTYLLDLDSSQFVYGELNQKSLDVIITIYSPEKEQIGKIDETIRYLESFHIESTKAGIYSIEVLPYMADSGFYAMEIKNIEPLATTPEKQLDQLIKAYDSDDRPGGAVAVLYNGEIAYTRAYGMANLTYGIPFTTETSSNIGSVSKHFTGFAIALLEKEGKLSLEDDVRTYIPELPDLGQTVTLRNLLNHTSGYRQIHVTFLMRGKHPGNRTRKEIIQVIQLQRELQNKPGAKHRYTNTNYILLAEVIGNITGMPFPEWMKVNVFDPLYMEHTTIKTTKGQIVPNSAQGYTFSVEGKQFVEGVDLNAFYGASSIYTTVGDLSKWLGNFGDARVGGPEVISRMTERSILKNGDTLNYALGLVIDNHRGLLRYQHTGTDGGQRSSLTYYPDIDAGIVFIGNGRIFKAINDKIIQIFLEEHLTPAEITESIEIQEEEASETNSALLDTYSGRFGSDESGQVIIFIREDNRLFAQYNTGDEHLSPLPLNPLSDSTFIDKNNDFRVSFHRDTDGQVKRATISRYRYWDEFEFHRLPDYNPSEEDLKVYTGLYHSPELETVYIIVIEDSRLTVKHHQLGDNKLTPKEQDNFSVRWPLSEIHFERNDNGNVSGFVVQNVHFEKLK